MSILKKINLLASWRESLVPWVGESIDALWFWSATLDEVTFYLPTTRMKFSPTIKKCIHSACSTTTWISNWRLRLLFAEGWRSYCSFGRRFWGEELCLSGGILLLFEDSSGTVGTEFVTSDVTGNCEWAQIVKSENYQVEITFWSKTSSSRVAEWMNTYRPRRWQQHLACVYLVVAK